jgi:predicted ABC-class ATPase
MMENKRNIVMRLISEIKLYTKLIVAKKFKKTEIIKGNIFECDLVITYYKFLGKKYFMKKIKVFFPPEHINCKGIGYL